MSRVALFQPIDDVKGKILQVHLPISHRRRHLNNHFLTLPAISHRQCREFSIEVELFCYFLLMKHLKSDELWMSVAVTRRYHHFRSHHDWDPDSKLLLRILC